MNLTKDKTLMLSTFFFRVILDLSYIYFVYPLYKTDFPYNPTAFKLIISYIILYVLVIITPKTNEKVSHMILQLHLFLIFIPLLSIYSVGDQSTTYVLFASVCYFLQAFIISHVKTPTIRRFRSERFTSEIIVVMLMVVTIVSYSYLFMTQRINFSVVDFRNVYEVREELEIGGGIIPYLLSWQYRIFNPLLLMNFAIKKKHKYFIFIVLLQIIFYLFLPFKEIFFSLFVVLFAYMIYKLNKNFSYIYSRILSFLWVFSVLIFVGLRMIMPLSIMVRTFFEPAKIKFQHFVFFSQHEKLFFSEGLIGKIIGIHYPYDVPSGFVVYRYFNGTASSNSNTGYIASAYSNAGFIGMIIMTLIFIFILLLIDSLIKGIDPKIGFAVLIYPMVILNDGDLLTSLLTGGLAILILILYYLLTDENIIAFKKIEDDT